MLREGLGGTSCLFEPRFDGLLMSAEACLLAGGISILRTTSFFTPKSHCCFTKFKSFFRYVLGSVTKKKLHKILRTVVVRVNLSIECPLY